MLSNKMSLNWLSQFENMNAKLERWDCLLWEFSFSFQHCPSSKTALPGAVAQSPDADWVIETLNDDDHLPSSNVNRDSTSSGAYLATISASRFYVEFQEAQKADSDLDEVAFMWKSIAWKDTRTLEEGTYFQRYLVDLSGLWKGHETRWVMVVPRECRDRILYEFHGTEVSGDSGGKKTQRAIQVHFTWNDIRKYTRDYVRPWILFTRLKSFSDQMCSITTDLLDSPWQQATETPC